MKQIGIYKISSTIKPERFYIGSSIDIKKRWKQHIVDLRSCNHASKTLQRHYDKYGINDLNFEIVVCCDNDRLIDTEQFYLDAYRPYFNSALFANKPPMLGRKHSMESRIKMSNVLSKRQPMSDETKAKISQSQKGKYAPWKFKPQSAEHIANRMKNRIGKKRPQDVRDKISKKLMGHPPTKKPAGRILSNDVKARISKTLTGKVHSNETKIKMRISAQKSINLGRFIKGRKISLEEKVKSRNNFINKIKNKSSIYTGVCKLYTKHKVSRYRAMINCNGHGVYLGTYRDEKVAAKIYDKAASLVFGVFANLNFK